MTVYSVYEPPTEAPDLAERLRHRLAEHDAGILASVMLIDMEVALSF